MPRRPGLIRPQREPILIAVNAAEPCASEAGPACWHYRRSSPLGDVVSSVELRADGLHCACEGLPARHRHLLRWDEIVEAATAVLEPPQGRRRGGPAMPAWVPDRLEWLLLARAQGPAVMQPLPDGAARESLLAALRQRLGPRWIGEGLPLAQARHRFRLSEPRHTPALVALVIATLAMLALLLLATTLAASLLLWPAGLLFGALLCRRGLIGLRDTLQMAQAPPSRVAAAAVGRVELEGRVGAGPAVPAAASGRPSLWWDVTVDVWSDRSEDGGWQPALHAHGGEIGLLTLVDATGAVPVWLRGADLLLEEHVWDSSSDTLPEHGVAWLAGTSLPWHDGDRRLRVRETRMEVGAPLYVHGRLDEARHLQLQDTLADRLLRPLRDGAWRQTLLTRGPALLRLPFGVALTVLEMWCATQRGGARRHGANTAPLPALAPTARVVWKGCDGHSLLVSDRRGTDALRDLRRRAGWTLGIGIGLIGLCLQETLSTLVLR